MKKIIYFTILYVSIILIVVYFKGYVKYISFIFMYVICLILIRKELYKMIRLKVIILSTIIIGVCILYIQYRWNNFEKKILVNDSSIFTGKILELKKETEFKYLYKFNIKNIDNKNCNFNIWIYTDKENVYEKGDIVICNIKLEEPEEASNYGGFNNKLYLYSNNIKEYGYMEKIYEVRKDKNKYYKYINEYKKEITKVILNKTDNNVAGIIICIMFGNKIYLTDEVKNIFSNANMSHILNISSTHIAYITYLYFAILSIFKAKKKKYSITFFIILTFYLTFINCSLSILKSYIIYLITFIYKIKKKQGNNILIIFLAGLIFIIYNPLYIFNVSFMLSFSCILGIKLFSKKFINKLEYNLNNKKKKTLSKINNILGVSIAVYISIFPLITIFFNKIYITTILSNIISIPIYGIVISLSFIFIILFNISFMANFILFILSFLVKILIIIAEYFSLIPLASILIFPFKWYETIIYYLIIYIKFISYKNYLILKYKVINIFKNISVKRKKLIIIYILIISVTIYWWKSNTLYIFFIDVGQGDSTLITNKGKNILVDGGGSNSKTFDIGEKILLPYLLNRRIKTIDYLIISHFDNDHVNGLYAIIENLKIKNIIISKQYEKSENFDKFIGIAKIRKINIIVVKAGDNIKINNNLKLNILWPCENQINENILNNNSIVFNLIYNEFKMLFTGDIEKIAENKIIEKYNNELKSTILKIPHHGSKTSTTKEFLEDVNPKFALIGVGRKNSFGHPNEDVIERLKNINCKTYRTDLNGEIQIKINKILNNVIINTVKKYKKDTLVNNT